MKKVILSGLMILALGATSAFAAQNSNMGGGKKGTKSSGGKHHRRHHRASKGKAANKNM
jgi:hypothetical protein